MFLNAFTDRNRPGLPKGGRKRLTFDFIVAERPIYVPCSGPPLAPVTVMPAHDKDGLIESMIQIDQKPTYIVSYEEHPYLRVSVKPQNILDWVSPRTLEEFEFAKTQKEDKALRDELLPKIAARERRKLVRRLTEQGVPVKESRVKGPPQGTKSRKRKRTPSPEVTSLAGMSAMPPPSGPGRKRKQVDDEGEVEEAVYVSQRRPSLSTPLKQRRLADIVDFESEDDDSFAEDTAVLLDRQLNGKPKSRSKLANELTRSPTTSPDPLSLKAPKAKTPRPKKPLRDFDRRGIRSGSISSINDTKRRETRSSSASGPPHRDSIAATSSREARAIYEKLERKSQVKAGSLMEKYSYSGKKRPMSTHLSTPASSSRQKTPSTHSTRKKSATPAPIEENDSEYEVDTILADEYRIVKGKHTLWYLIKWVGEWPHSWEPAENVGVDAIAEYEENKRVKQAKIGRFSIAMDDAISSGYKSSNGELKDNRKENFPFGSGGMSGGMDVEDDESESDEEDLFVKDRSKSRDVAVEKQALSELEISRRGEVIIDDGDDSDEF